MSQDFRDLLAAFNALGVEFLLVGAHAMAAHGIVRATEDIDIWIRPDQSNAKRVVEVGRKQDLADVEKLEAKSRNPDKS